MIVVHASHDGTGQTLAELRIEWLEQVDDEWHKYSLQVAVEGITELNLHQRIFYHKRLQNNTLSLILAALTSLKDEDLKLPDGTTAEHLRFRI